MARSRVENDETDFLLGEYAALWAEHGIEDLAQATGSLKARLRSKRLSAPRPEPSPNASPPPQTLQAVRDWIGDCRRCGLCEARNQIVFGVGNPRARLVFIGEGPGADEDTQGVPFVGKAGQLLDRIIEAMGMRREDVYIANIVKCRPPGNRAPAPEEVAHCLPFLHAQIRLISPQLIISLGATATAALVTRSGSISSIRGKFLPLAWDSGISVLPTFHPAYLLRNPASKKLVWDDMKLALAHLESKN